MRNCLTNTKGLVKIEMQINSTKSDSDFSVVHIYRKLQEKISFLVSLDKQVLDEHLLFLRRFCRQGNALILITKAPFREIEAVLLRSIIDLLN